MLLRFRLFQVYLVNASIYPKKDWKQIVAMKLNAFFSLSNMGSLNISNIECVPCVLISVEVTKDHFEEYMLNWCQ